MAQLLNLWVGREGPSVIRLGVRCQAFRVCLKGQAARASFLVGFRVFGLGGVWHRLGQR